MEQSKDVGKEVSKILFHNEILLKPSPSPTPVSAYVLEIRLRNNKNFRNVFSSRKLRDSLADTYCHLLHLLPQRNGQLFKTAEDHISAKKH
ncbi:hypothetical protein CEXT_421211 [Caerostris extrusa]|uniref:Uncharacterized protein n=1 Tax=Caerostris extrusa TaxID=172846 RepID=A0AAV4XN51_CAEEX|nr:hypothetical protein CEXT_421211 [Caerostris extrusa]